MGKELHSIEVFSSKPSEVISNENVRGENLYKTVNTRRKSKMCQKAESSKALSQNSAKSIMNEMDKERLVLKIVVDRLHIEDGKQSYRIKQNEPSPSTSQSSVSESISEEEYKPDHDDDSDDNEEEDDTDDDTDDDEDLDVSNDEEENVDAYISDHEHLDSNVQKNAKTPVRARTLKSDQPVAPVVFSEYHIKSGQYFESQGTKIRTSNKTLSRLKNAALKPEQMRQLLISQSHITKEHVQALSKLSESCLNAFPMWEFILEEGFNLLLYGLGSKRNIILDFQKEMVPDHPSVVINGYFPSLTLKEILDAIIVDLLELSPIVDANECFNVIDTTMRESPNDRLYLFIHNIDGPTLLSNKVQDFLSRLATIPNVHMIASVDHTNAPILWDNVKRSRFNFFWWDATTFLPYREETSYESSVLVQHSGILALSSLQSVFRSLTSNAKKIYVILVQYQIENGNSLHYQGMPFKQLYKAAKEEFAVSSDAALRAQLVEFHDHKLIKQKRNAEGTEYLTIPLKKDILLQFLDQEEKI